MLTEAEAQEIEKLREKNQQLAAVIRELLGVMEFVGNDLYHRAKTIRATLEIKDD